MPLNDCLTKAAALVGDAREELIRRRDELVSGGMTELEADRRVKDDFVSEKHRELSDNLNKLRTNIGLKAEQYAPITEPDLSKIHSRYDEQIAKLKPVVRVTAEQLQQAQPKATQAPSVQGSGEIKLSNEKKLVKNEEKSVKAGNEHYHDNTWYDVKDEKGNDLGNVQVGERGDHYKITNINLTKQKEGIGTDIYIKLGLSLDKPLYSDRSRTPAATKLWEKLVRMGVAEKFTEPDRKAYEATNYRMLDKKQIDDEIKRWFQPIKALGDIREGKGKPQLPAPKDIQQTPNEGGEARNVEVNVSGAKFDATVIEDNGETLTVRRSDNGFEMVVGKEDVTDIAGVKPTGEISEAAYSKFIDTGKVDKPVIDNIISKIKSGEDLSEREQAILTDKARQIGDILEKEHRKEKQQSFNAKIDSIASQVVDALSAKLPEGTRKQGLVSMEDIVKGAAEIVKTAYRLGTDVKAAIDKAVIHVRDHWLPGWGTFPESIVRKHLEDAIKVPDVNKAISEKFADVTPEEAHKLIMDQQDRTQRAIEEKRKRTFGKLYRWYVKHIEDISGNVKEALKNAGGIEAVMLKDIANKAGGKAGLKIEENNKKLFKGLSDSEFRDLAAIINTRRTALLDRIYDLRGQERLKHADGYSSELHEAAVEKIKADDPKRYDRLSKLADGYFKAFQELLDMKKENGLVSDELYDALQEQFYYSPRVYIDKLDTIDGEFAGGRKVSVGDSGVKALDEGSEGLMILDPKLLLSMATEKTYKLMAKNDAAKALYRLAKVDPSNGVVEMRKVIRVTKEGNVVYQDVPKDKALIHAMVDGYKKDMMMSVENANEWVATDPAIASKLGEAIQWLSGTSFIRLAATGLNPVFALANVPRDMAFIYFTTDAYSKTLPAAMAQISKDMLTVAHDVFRRKGRYKEYIDEGGSIELLTHQGRLNLLKGENEGWNKLTHVMGWLGETSELMTRLAMRERGIRNGTAEFQEKNSRAPTSEELKKIKIKATYDAINQLDFSQGGDWAKVANKFVPYFNAAIQAQRGLVRSIRKDPKSFGYKAAQFAAIAGGLTVYNVMQPGYDDVDPGERARNWIIMTPFYRYDEKGRKRYRYIKIPKSQEVQALSSIVDQVTDYVMTGKAPDRETFEAANNQLPDVPLVTQGAAFREAYLSYRANYDFYFNSRIWKGKESTPLKDQYISTTPEAYKIAGEYFNVSPIRLRTAVLRVLPSTEKNPFITIPTKGFGLAFEVLGLKEKDELNKGFLQHLTDVTGGLSGKYVGESFPQDKKKK